MVLADHRAGRNCPEPQVPICPRAPNKQQENIHWSETVTHCAKP